MGLRTHWNGIFSANIGSIVKRRGLDNLFTSYISLSRKFEGGEKMAVRVNLISKVKEGLIGLEELLSGGRAAELYQRAGLFSSAVRELAERKAERLLASEAKLDRFLLSGKKSVPYVIEKLPVNAVAESLRRVSKTVKQRSVIKLSEIMRNTPPDAQKLRSGQEYELNVVFSLEYEEEGEKIETKYFPGNVQKIFCFAKREEGIRGINRGVVISDRYVENMSEILDALAQIEVSPLDYILISLREIQGLMKPALPSTVNSWPKLEPERFVAQDHFTETARGALHDLVCGEFEKMKNAGGDPLSFTVYYRPEKKDDDNLRIVNISWKKS